jgi:hypothetical protein
MNRVVLAAVVAVLAMPGTSWAHRLDEYLQASRVSLARDAVVVEVDLTSGASIASTIVALLDRDGDWTISPDEAGAYGQAVVADLALDLDGRAVPLTLTRVETPSIPEIHEGMGTIRLYASGGVDAAAGRRTLRLRNNHSPVASVYLANALVPDDRAIDVVAQTRDTRQQELRVEYAIGARWPARLLWLSFGAAGLAMLVIARRLRLR